MYAGNHLLRITLRRMWFVIACIGLGETSNALALDIQVLDRNGTPLSDVVVTVSDGHDKRAAATRPLLMDQLNMRFVPQVLIAPLGVAVSFPNSDSVSHQVYSFSRPKPFQLPLYKGKIHSPIVFDQPGLVVLGCNIHDNMVGYIYVTAAHWYGLTDKEGHFMLVDTPPGKVSITIWSPLIADAAAVLTREVELSADTRVEFKLGKALRSSPEPRPRNTDWDY